MLILDNIMDSINEIPKIQKQNLELCKTLNKDLTDKNFQEVKSNLAMFDQHVANFLASVNDSIIKGCPLKINIASENRIFYTIPSSEKMNLISFLSIHEDGDEIPMVDTENQVVTRVRLTRLAVINALKEHEEFVAKLNKEEFVIAAQAAALLNLLKTDGYDFDKRNEIYDNLLVAFMHIKDHIKDYHKEIYGERLLEVVAEK